MGLCQIGLVSDEDDVLGGAHGGIVYEALNVVLNGLEGGSFGHVVDRETPMCVPEVRLRDRAEPFLTCRVPDLHLGDVGPVNL